MPTSPLHLHLCIGQWFISIWYRLRSIWTQSGWYFWRVLYSFTRSTYFSGCCSSLFPSRELSFCCHSWSVSFTSRKRFCQFYILGRICTLWWPEIVQHECIVVVSLLCWSCDSHSRQLYCMPSLLRWLNPPLTKWFILGASSDTDFARLLNVWHCMS